MSDETKELVLDEFRKLIARKESALDWVASKAIAWGVDLIESQAARIEQLQSTPQAKLIAEQSNTIGELRERVGILSAELEAEEIGNEQLTEQATTLRAKLDVVERADSDFRSGGAGYITWSYAEKVFYAHSGKNMMTKRVLGNTLMEALEALAAEGEDAAKEKMRE